MKNFTQNALAIAAATTFVVSAAFAEASWAKSFSQASQTEAKQSAPADVYDGTITTIMERQLVVNVDGQDMTFLVMGDTEITLDGQVVTLDKLQGGFSAKVTTKPGGEPPTAQSIEAMTAK